MSLRIVLTVTEANPELYAALQAVSTRHRAERVRTLATLGLATLSGGIGTHSVPATEAGFKDKNLASDATGRALNFAKTLIGGI